MSRAYDKAARAATSASEAAHKGGDQKLHEVAAAHHRIAAEYAGMDGEMDAMNMHKDHAEMHSRAAEREKGADSAEKRKAAYATLNELACKRMSKNEALMASVKGNGYSLTDLQTEVCSELGELAMFKSSSGTPCCGPWCCDIVAPAHEAGETWQAVVNGADGKLYCVEFQIDEDEIEIIGEPKEVQRSTDYEYVDQMEAEAKAAGGKSAVTAGYFGNQHKSAQDVADEYSTVARVASREAAKASKGATDTGTHNKAASAQEAARAAHETAAAKQLAAGDSDAADEHTEKATKHLAKKDEHAKAMESCQTQDAGSDKGALKARSVDCSIKGANAIRSGVPDVADIMQYMPGGTHRITPSQNGEPVELVVLVDEKTADKLEAQRKSLDGSGKKPFFSIQHETEIAAAWVKRFFWDRRLDATGSFSEGVWAEVEWTKSGREAVEGKDFRTFSPTFFVDAIRDNPEKPSRIVCNEDARANMGALENDPAFQKISPLWARNSANGEKPVTAAMVKECHEEIRSSNPDLVAVARRVHGKHGVWLDKADIAKLMAE